MDWIIAGVIVLFGAALALRDSSWAVDYAIIVFVFNRGLRRILDWHAGEFNPFSPISLTPLMVAGFMAIPFFLRMNTLSPRLRRVFLCLMGALSYAFLIGFLNVRMAAVYALAEYVAPIAMFGFAIVSFQRTTIRDRWIKTMSWSAVLASIYGWYQYLVIPPWDAMWVRAVGFEGYLGILEPTKMAVFSTMGERGPLATYLGLALIAMIVSPRWRTFLSWVAVVLVILCVVLTQARFGLIAAGIGVLSFVLINRGASLQRILVALAIGAVFFQYGLDHLPGSEALQKRVSTLQNMADDGSLATRLAIYRGSISTILTHPIGYGLGSSGFATRINSGSMQSESVIGDAGYSEFFLTFGWFGACLFLAGLTGIWREMSIRYQAGMRHDGLLLGRALLLGLIPMCAVGNLLAGVSLFWLSFGVALGPLPRRNRRKEIPDSDGLKTLHPNVAPHPVG